MFFGKPELTIFQELRVPEVHIIGHVDLVCWEGEPIVEKCGHWPAHKQGQCDGKLRPGYSIKYYWGFPKYELLFENV